MAGCVADNQALVHSIHNSQLHTNILNVRFECNERILQIRIIIIFYGACEYKWETNDFCFFFSFMNRFSSLNKSVAFLFLTAFSWWRSMCQESVHDTFFKHLKHLPTTIRWIRWIQRVIRYFVDTFYTLSFKWHDQENILNSQRYKNQHNYWISQMGSCLER